MKSLFKLLFQCLFFSVLVYVCSSIFTKTLSIHGLLRSILLLADFWFVKAYIALFIFAPVLNQFIKSSDKRIFSVVLGGLFIFQLIFGCTNQVRWIDGGYSFYSFVCLYLLAQYIKLYQSHIVKYGWLLFSTGVFGSFILYTFGLQSQLIAESILYDISFWYISPFVVITALGILFIFLNIKIEYNNIINKIAVSSFAVFLLHGQGYFWDNIFIKGVIYLFGYYKTEGVIYSTLTFLLIFAFILIIFIVAILLDKIRILIWNKLIVPKISNTSW